MLNTLSSPPTVFTTSGLNTAGLNTNALALPTSNAGNPLFNLGATQGLLSPQTPSLSNNLLSGFNAVPNTTGSIFANLPGNGALSFANPSTSGTVAPQGGESSALLAGLDQFLKSVEPQVNFFAQNRTGAMGSPTTAMGALANLPAVAPAAQTTVAPVAPQIVLSPEWLSQLLGSRVANNNSDTEDTSVTQALEAKIEKLEDQIKVANGTSSTTIAQQLEVLKTQLAQIKANTVQAKTTPPQATLQARLKELEAQVATLKKAPITATTPVAKAPVKTGVKQA
jgi:hypothetical protein